MSLSVLSLGLMSLNLISASFVFEPKTLTVDGDTLDVIAPDLDGDGKKDLLVVYKTGVEPNEKRFLAIFWNRAGRYYERPDAVLNVDDESCAFDAADIDEAPGEELLVLGPNGVEARSFAGRKVGDAAAIVRQRTLFPLADPGELPRLHLVHALSAADSRELFIHAPGGLDIFKRAETGIYERAVHLQVALESNIEKKQKSRAERRSKNVPALSMTLTFPSITVIDTDADGMKDLVMTLDDRVAIYRQYEPMKLREKPSFTRDFAVRSLEDRKESFSWVGLSVIDLDGDGAADLMVRKNVAHGIASASSSNYLYLGKKSGKYSEKPDQTLETEGAGGAEVELYDVTADGHADLIVPSVNIGVMAIIRWLTSESLNVNTMVFSFDAKKRRFTEKPVAERELSFNLELKGERDSEAFDMVADYDGDHLPDLVFASGEEELSIYRGLGGGSLFASDATAKISARAYGELLSVDLNGTGRSDMVLRYSRTNGHRGEVVVLRNMSDQGPAQAIKN